MMKKFIQKKINKNARFIDSELDEDSELKQYIKGNDEDNFSKK